VAGGRVVGVGVGRAPDGTVDLGDVALLPGLVNAHTHLELSWMGGAVPPAVSMSEWIRAVVALRRGGVPGGREAEVRAARDAAASVVATGTALVGDVSNTLLTPALLTEAGLGGVVFHELIGFNAIDPAGDVRAAWTRIEQMSAHQTGNLANPREPLSFSVVAHAPYSVSPALFAAILARSSSSPLAIHLAESAEEIEFLRTGLGPIRRMLEQLGVWSGSWAVPRCDPVQYMSDLGYLRPGTLVVHCVHVTDRDLDRLRDARAVVVTCPRSNLWVGTGPPRLSRFYAAGLAVAVGTDSLASAPSVNLFDELAEMRRLAPEISASTLLESATKVGADALGFSEYGTIRPGQRAVFAAVEVPRAGLADVEEYLVSGVPARAIRRVA